MKKALAIAALCPFAAAQSIQTALVAQDAVYARVADHGGTHTVYFQQSQPAGPIYNGFALAVPGASYSCTLSTAGGAAHLQCSTLANPPSSQAPSIFPETHADLLLTVSGMVGTAASVELLLTHFGDMASSYGFSVDLRNDGTPEITTAGPAGSPWHHRMWTWDFAQGPLAIRIHTDQAEAFGAQGYGLVLDVQSWVSNAHPHWPDCGLVNYVRDPQFIRAETSNFGLAALPSAQPQQLALLHAVGLGQFGLFVVAADPSVWAVAPLPSPMVPLLSAIVFQMPGAVAARTTNGVAGMPRTWEIAVPQLPPGFTFYVQHASAIIDQFIWLGTTNVIRIDT